MDPSDSGKKKRRMSFSVHGGDTRKVTRDFAVKKKHRLNRFSRMGSALEVNVDCGLGAAEKCTGSEFRSALADAIERDVVVVRPLGSPVQMAEIHFSQSMMGEICEEENTLSRLQRQMDDVVKSLSLMKQRMKEQDLFLEDGRALAVRAFCDKVLCAFFHFAGVLDDRGRWLRSVAAEQFVKQHLGEFVLIQEFGGGGFFVSERVLRALRSLKVDSSSISARTCHSSSPVRVAIAAQELMQFKGDGDFHWLFQQIFKIGASEMRKNFDAGVGDNYNISFVV